MARGKVEVGAVVARGGTRVSLFSLSALAMPYVNLGAEKCILLRWSSVGDK